MYGNKFALLAVAMGLAVGQACATDASFTKTTGFTTDGRGAQIVVYPAAGMTFDAKATAMLAQEALDAYANLHPEHQGSTVVSIGQQADGRIEATVLPYAVPPGQTTSTTGSEPPTPEPPPSNPNGVTRIDYHITNYNGWNRDTSYRRDRSTGPSGGDVYGDWSKTSDNLYESPTSGAGGGGPNCHAHGNCPAEQ
ncbi:MAG: hypothetical protein ABIO49_09610 [Dokdonella sp.]